MREQPARRRRSASGAERSGAERSGAGDGRATAAPRRGYRKRRRRRRLCRRFRPATPSWTRRWAPTSRTRQEVSIQTQWIGGEGEGFAAAIADFATATGIAIQIDSIGSSHETVLKTRIEGGSPPDMAVLAQPTGVLAYAADGKLIDVATFMDAAKLKR